MAMLSKRFILSGLAATCVNLVMHAAAYFLFLKGFYRAHPAGSQAFMSQLARSPGELVGWAMAVSALTMGFLIAAVMRWAGATSFVSGLKVGAVFGLLFWASVNFGLFASSHFFSRASVFADCASSATVMAISSAIAAAVLGRGKVTSS
jgi:hypothetical protein